MKNEIQMFREMGMSDLMISIRKRDRELFTALLAESNFDLKERDLYGYTAFDWAKLMGDYYFLESIAEIKTKKV